jgi:spoIIIJ-associated protein
MEVREFAADSLEGAVEKAAKHFGVPSERIDVRVLSGKLPISGVGGRVLVLATVRKGSARREVERTPAPREVEQTAARREVEQTPAPREVEKTPASPEAEKTPAGLEVGEGPVDLGPTGAFVYELLQRMGAGEGLRVDEVQEGGELIVRVRGDQVKSMARRDRRVHGALAHLANRVAQRVLEPDMMARIDLEADHAGEERLEEMARSRAQEALSKRQEVLLPAMDSRERWVVHNALKSVDGIRSESVGTGRLKRVKILPV